MQEVTLAGLAVATLVLGGCTTAAVGPKSSPPEVAVPRCAHSTSFGVMVATAGGSSGAIGQPSPIAAAEHLAGNDLLPRIPSSGWHDTEVGSGSAPVASGNTVLHAVRTGEGRWIIDSGTTCA